MLISATELRTSKEKLYGLLTIAVGGLLWALIAWRAWSGLTSANAQTATMTKMYIGYGIAFAVVVFVSSAFYRATAFGNMVLLGPRQFPELHAMVAAGAQALGMEEAPSTFVYNSNGLFNAFARRLLGGKYVFLTSALVDATTNDQVRFVIGHELGHHAAGHLNPWLNIVRLPTRMIPFLYSAYSRAREYTCDRIGAEMSRNTAVSVSSLQMLGCGCARLNSSMNSESFAQQEEMVPPIAGYFSEVLRSHPRLTRRISAIAFQQFQVSPRTNSGSSVNGIGALNRSVVSQ